MDPISKLMGLSSACEQKVIPVQYESEDGINVQEKGKQSCLSLNKFNWRQGMVKETFRIMKRLKLLSPILKLIILIYSQMWRKIISIRGENFEKEKYLAIIYHREIFKNPRTMMLTKTALKPRKRGTAFHIQKPRNRHYQTK